MASMQSETEDVTRLQTSREPKASKRPGDPGSIGDKALMDALFIIIAGWVFLAVLMFSLRGHNI